MDTLSENIRGALQKPIVMIGLMGAGKTKIGGLVAAALGLPFVDADDEIESSAGRTVAQIFEEYGEAAFRDLERRVIARLLSEEVKVIATGGGAVMQPQTATLIKSQAVSIWLSADVDVLVARTAEAKKRPLLKGGDPQVILSQLLDKRAPVYAQADIVVPSGVGTPEVVCHSVLTALNTYLQGQKEKNHG
jgi:shikimate kinase